MSQIGGRVRSTSSTPLKDEVLTPSTLGSAGLYDGIKGLIGKYGKGNQKPARAYMTRSWRRSPLWSCLGTSATRTNSKRGPHQNTR